MESLTGGSMQSAIRTIAAIATMLVLVFMYGPWQLALFLFGAMPLMFAIMGTMITILMGDELKEAKGQQVNNKKANAERSAGKLLSEVVLSIRTVASFNAEQRFYDDFCVGVDKARAMEAFQFKVATVMALTLPVMLYIFAGMNHYLGFLISHKLTLEEGMCHVHDDGRDDARHRGGDGHQGPRRRNTAAQRFFEVTEREPHRPNERGRRQAGWGQGRRGGARCRLRVLVGIAHRTQRQPDDPCRPDGRALRRIGERQVDDHPAHRALHDPQRLGDADGADIKTLNVRWLRQRSDSLRKPVPSRARCRATLRTGRRHRRRRSRRRHGWPTLTPSSPRTSPMDTTPTSACEVAKCRAVRSSASRSRVRF